MNAPKESLYARALARYEAMDSGTLPASGPIFAPMESEPSSFGTPCPLPDELPPVLPMDANMLPEALRAWVLDIAHRMQCPPDFTAVAAITALSSLVGARITIQPKRQDDWKVVPNLWGLVIGRPGVMKSPALTQALAPLHRLEKNERENFESLHEKWQIDCKVADLAAKANEREAAKIAKSDPQEAARLLTESEPPPEPTIRRFIANDATVEKLGEMLGKNPFGFLAYRDEMYGLLQSMERAGQEGARGFYLTAYDGNQPYSIDRIARGEMHIPHVVLSMLGSIQPARIDSYVRAAVKGGEGDDGLLQRFALTVWPDIDQDFTYVDQWPDTPARQAAWHVYERFSLIEPQEEPWRFDDEAQELFRTWMTDFETEIRGEELHPALISHLAKYRKLVPALALIFALIDTPESGQVHIEQLWRALRWAKYLRSHAERMYAAAVTPEYGAAKTLLQKIENGKLIDTQGVQMTSFAPREVAVKGWTGLSASEDVRQAAEILCEYGYLSAQIERAGSGSGGGRPKERYLLHPSLLQAQH